MESLKGVSTLIKCVCVCVAAEMVEVGKRGHSGEKDQYFLFYFIFYSFGILQQQKPMFYDVWTELITANDNDCCKITLCCAFKFNQGLLSSSGPVLVAGFKWKMLSQLPGASLE